MPRRSFSLRDLGVQIPDYTNLAQIGSVNPIDPLGFAGDLFAREETPTVIDTPILFDPRQEQAGSEQSGGGPKSIATPRGKGGGATAEGKDKQPVVEGMERDPLQKGPVSIAAEAKSMMPEGLTDDEVQRLQESEAFMSQYNNMGNVRGGIGQGISGIASLFQIGKAKRARNDLKALRKKMAVRQNYIKNLQETAGARQTEIQLDEAEREAKEAKDTVAARKIEYDDLNGRDVDLGVAQDLGYMIYTPIGSDSPRIERVGDTFNVGKDLLNAAMNDNPYLEDLLSVRVNRLNPALSKKTVAAERAAGQIMQQFKGRLRTDDRIRERGAQGNDPAVRGVYKDMAAIPRLQADFRNLDTTYRLVQGKNTDPSVVSAMKSARDRAYGMLSEKARLLHSSINFTSKEFPRGQFAKYGYPAGMDIRKLTGMNEKEWSDLVGTISREIVKPTDNAESVKGGEIIDVSGEEPGGKSKAKEPLTDADADAIINGLMAEHNVTAERAAQMSNNGIRPKNWKKN